jgi:hypothetical protein
VELSSWIKSGVGVSVEKASGLVGRCRGCQETRLALVLASLGRLYSHLLRRVGRIRLHRISGRREAFQ